MGENKSLNVTACLTTEFNFDISLPEDQLEILNSQERKGEAYHVVAHYLINGKVKDFEIKEIKEKE